MRAELVALETEGISRRNMVLEKTIDEEGEACSVSVGIQEELGCTQLYLPQQVTLREQEELYLLIGNVQVVWTPEEWRVFKRGMNRILKAGRANRDFIYEHSDDEEEEK